MDDSEEKQQYYTEYTDTINGIDFYGKADIMQLLSRFDIEQSPRSEVKHYEIQDVSSDSAEELMERLKTLAQAHWYSFSQYVRLAILEKYGGDSEAIIDLFLSSALPIGKVRVTPPLTFKYVNTPLDALKLFAFVRPHEEGMVRIKAELDYTIEIY